MQLDDGLIIWQVDLDFPDTFALRLKEEPCLDWQKIPQRQHHHRFQMCGPSKVGIHRGVACKRHGENQGYTAEAIEFCANEFDKQVGEALSTANTYAASNAELGAKYTPK